MLAKDHVGLTAREAGHGHVRRCISASVLQNHQVLPAGVSEFNGLAAKAPMLVYVPIRREKPFLWMAKERCHVAQVIPVSERCMSAVLVALCELDATKHLN